MADRSFPSPGVWSSSLPSRMYRRESSGRLRAICATRVPTAAASAASDFINFSRAGVLKKSSRTAMGGALRAPGGLHLPGDAPLQVEAGPGLGPPLPGDHVRRLTAADSRQSLAPEAKGADGGQVLGGAELAGGVAEKAVGSSWGAMPQPSSVTRIRAMPPERISTVTAAAPASMAFSMSSLTTLAGRSTTSPAAIRSATWGESCWIWAFLLPLFARLCEWDLRPCRAEGCIFLIYHGHVGASAPTPPGRGSFAPRGE